MVDPPTDEIVRRLVSEAAHLPVDEIADDTDVLTLGIDSLDFASILVDIEDQVGIEVPIDLLELLLSQGKLPVGDLIEAAEKLRASVA